jgi:hypothetical protein
MFSAAAVAAISKLKVSQTTMPFTLAVLDRSQHLTTPSKFDGG